MAEARLHPPVNMAGGGVVRGPDEYAEGGRVVRLAAGLAEAARAARAREQGFRPEVFYHGRQGDFGAFDPATVRRGSAGGHWMTRDLGYAESYAPTPQPRHVDPLGIVHGGNIMPLRTRAQAIGTAREYNALNDEAEALGVDLRDLMRERGIDAFAVEGSPRRPRTLVVRDPEMIRSAHAAFDPAKRDSSDLLASGAAGVGAAGLGGWEAFSDEPVEIVRRYARGGLAAPEPVHMAAGGVVP